MYCRVRPFIGGQKGKQSIMEHVGEDGELVVVNPAKPGKEGRRSFNFDKVYGPSSTQGLFCLHKFSYKICLQYKTMTIIFVEYKIHLGGA